MKLKVTNIYSQPYGIHTAEGFRTLAVGESYEGEFAEGEARNLNGNSKVFKVEGYVEPAPGQSEQVAARNDDPDGDAAFKASVGPIANRLGIHDGAQFTSRVTAALDDGDKARAELQAIADLFGSAEIDSMNVKAAVERLLQDQKNATDKVNGMANQPADLAAAVALLDDKNDEHWTQAGQPKLAALEKLFGKDVSAADYAALTDAQKRVRKTA
jgi:hypothetical protein